MGYPRLSHLNLVVLGIIALFAATMVALVSNESKAGAATIEGPSVAQFEQVSPAKAIASVGEIRKSHTPDLGVEMKVKSFFGTEFGPNLGLQQPNRAEGEKFFPSFDTRYWDSYCQGDGCWDVYCLYSNKYSTVRLTCWRVRPWWYK